MKMALICEKCHKIHDSENDEGTIIFDYNLKRISFFCQNKKCKHDNIFQMDSWVDTAKKSPLPRIKFA